MVARNPLFSGRWTVKKFNATVINDIWPEVAFFSLVAAMVSLVSEKTKHKLSISNALLTVLGTVLGLVISFRTSSAYERYQDGRKMWTNIATASRNIGQMIWIHVPNNRKQGNELQSVIEKKTMINLVHAFAVSVKHFLRGEEGVYYEDLYPLISFLPKYANTLAEGQTEADKLPVWQARDGMSPVEEHFPHDATLVGRSRAGSPGSTPGRSKTFDPEKALPTVECDRPLKPARNPPQTTIFDFIPLLRFFKWCVRIVLRRAKPGEPRRRRKANPELVESHIPLEISLFLSNYSAYLMRSNLVPPAIATGITNNIGMLSDTLSNLERICNTPLPFAYQAHLRMSLWLYLFFLPFQIWSAFRYLTIPGTAFASFLLLGFLEIGQEIENPFNYDLNDLDLDHFCLAIQRELHEITAHTCPDPSEYVFTTLNQPFAPADNRTADELVKSGEDYHIPDNSVEPGTASIRRTLLKGWKDVDSLTRKMH